MAKDTAAREHTSCGRARDLLLFPTLTVKRALLAWTKHVVCKHPRKVVAASVAVALILAVGILRIDVRTKTDELWVPQNSQIMHNRAVFRKTFGAEPVFALAMLHGKSKSENILTYRHIETLYEIDQGVMKIGEGKPSSYKAVCYKDGAQNCVNDSALSLWCSRDHFYREVMSADDPQEALMRIVNERKVTCGGRDARPEALYGSLRRDPASGNVTFANALQLSYLVENSAERTSFEKLFKSYMIDVGKKIGKRDACCTVWYVYFGAFDEEINRSIVGDIPLVAASFLLIIIGMIVTQYRRRSSNEPDFAMLSFWGAVGVFLSVAMGYGIVIGAGVPFTSLAQIGPFIFLGIGVDDVILMLEGIRNSRRVLGIAGRDAGGANAHERVEHMMERAGISITVTSVTNVLAFGLGSTTAIPAVSWFCIYSMVAILCDYLVQSSFFLAIVVMREEKVDRDAATAPSSSTAMAPEENKDGVSSASPDARKSEGIFAVIIERHANFVRRVPVRIVVVLVFVAYGLFSAFGEPKIKRGLPRTDLAPDKSFLRDYFKVQDATYASQIGLPLYMCQAGVDHNLPEVRARMYASWGAYMQNRWIDFESVDAGINSAQSYSVFVQALGPLRANATRSCRSYGISQEICNAAGWTISTISQKPLEQVLTDGGPTLYDEDAFRQVSKQVFSTGYGTFRNDVKTNENNDIIATRMFMRTKPVFQNAAYQVEVYREMMKLDSQINEMYWKDFPGRPHFIYSEPLVYFQQDAILWDELILNLSLAGTGVFIVCCLVLANPAAFIATLAIGVIDLFLFGTMYIGGIKFNIIAAVNLVMAVGLAVDYTLHFIHAFMSTPPELSRDDRMVLAMKGIGRPIALGVFTTFLGTLPMAASSSTIFRTFFAMLVSTVVYGMAVGLVLLPVLLASIPLPPAAHLSEKNESTSFDSRGISGAEEGAHFGSTSEVEFATVPA